MSEGGKEGGREGGKEGDRVEAMCPIDGCNLSRRPHLRGS